MIPIYYNGPLITSPKIELIVWGNWADPSGEIPILKNFFSGIGTNNEGWSKLIARYSTQKIFSYYVKISYRRKVHKKWKTFSRKVLRQIKSGYKIPYTSGIYNGLIIDPNSGPVNPSFASIANEAKLAPKGTIPVILGAPGQVTAWTSCAWHDAAPSPFIWLPYTTDAGYSFGGQDGITLISSHEYAETLTDPYGNGWGVGTEEIADPCAWAFSSYVTFSTGTFPVSDLLDPQTGLCTGE